MAVDMFIKIGDLKGESSDKSHKDEIDVLAWSWGMSLAFRAEDRYRVITVALLRSSAKMSRCSMVTRWATLFFSTLARDSLTRSGEMS